MEITGYEFHQITVAWMIHAQDMDHDPDTVAFRQRPAEKMTAFDIDRAMHNPDQVVLRGVVNEVE